jgi:hypothetical protein
MIDYFKQLIALRRDNPCLHSCEWIRLDAEPSLSLFGYLRFVSDGDVPPVLVVLNFSANDVDATIVLPTNDTGLVGRGTMTDLITDEQFPVSGQQFILSVPSWGVRALASARATSASLRV